MGSAGTAHSQICAVKLADNVVITGRGGELRAAVLDLFYKCFVNSSAGLGHTVL